MDFEKKGVCVRACVHSMHADGSHRVEHGSACVEQGATLHLHQSENDDSWSKQVTVCSHFASMQFETSHQLDPICIDGASVSLIAALCVENTSQCIMS